ncbi:MAG: ADP-glyceromanno-heptose 6-epimerase [Candidatus Kapaibacterium sp.]
MIVLTGGAGFIGSCFLKKLNDMGITDVLVVDHLGHGNKWKNLTGKIFTDFVHKNKFRRHLREGLYIGRIEKIVHFGACSSTTERDADYLLDNNLSYSKELAEYAHKRNLRYIYASSAATYGNGEYGYSDKVFDKYRPLNAYGLSKHIFDQWVVKNGFDEEFTGIKFFNVFGPNEYHKGQMASMIYKSYLQIKDTGKVRLFKSYDPEYPDGGQMRDFIYIKDVIEFLWKMFTDENFSGIYNLGTGIPRTWNDLANAVFSAMGEPVNIEYIDMPEEIKNQYQYYTKADMEKLNSTNCSMQFRTLEDSVKDYVKKYLDNNIAIF